jgi:glycosyltransferase involved in cell wall biosynthesis
LVEPVTFSICAHAWDIYAGDGLLAEKIKRASFVATCTEYNASHLRTLAADPSKIALNYHGLLDFAAPEPERLPEPTILAVGRLAETKGFDHLIRAFAFMASARPGLKLRIIGSGPLEEPLRRLAGELDVRDRVQFVGTVDSRRVASEMKRATLLAVPSVIAANGDRDGIPNVILEAGNLGLPVVASNLSGIPEAVEHERTGLLVEPGDPGKLAAAFWRILLEDGLAARLTEGLRRRVRERFDARANAVHLAQLLSEVS